MKRLFNSLSVLSIALVLLGFPVFVVQAQAEQPPPAAVTVESAFLEAAINGVPLALLPFGIVAFLKKQGVQGSWLLFSSLGAGLLFGVGFMVYKTRPPTGDWWVAYGYWFGNIVYGLGLGLLASGVYEGVRGAVTSVLSKMASQAVANQNNPEG